ncbi:MAG: hypothetical protein FWD43_05545, partial [Coriobacteriia bacterium]|nr:hypothetical protein [Coriobacteriia bacterium]
MLPSFSFLALGNMGGEGEGEDIITVPEDPTGDDPGIIAPLDIELVYAPALINFWLLDEDGNAPTDPSQTVTKEVVVGQTAYASWYSNTYTPEGYAYNENSDLNKNEYAEVTVGGVTLNLYYHLVVEGSTEGEEGEEGGEEPIVVDPIALYTIVFDFGAGSNLAPLVIQVFENGKTIGDFLSEGVPTGPVAPKSSIYTFTGWSPSWNLTDTITSSMVFVAQWTQSIPNTSGHGWNTVLGTANFQNYSIPGNAIELTFEGVSSSGQTTLDHAYMIVNDDGSLTLLFLAWSSSKDFNNSGSFMDYAGIKGTMKAYYKKDNKNMYAAFELTIPASMIYSIATQVQRINIVNEGSPGHSVVDAPLRFLNINIMTEHYIYDPAIGVESATLRITVPGVGIIGSPFTAKPLYFYGYVYDEGNPLSATSGIVTESGTLILKLYYYKTGDYLWKITGTSATTTYNNASQSLTSVLGP